MFPDGVRRRPWHKRSRHQDRERPQRGQRSSRATRPASFSYPRSSQRLVEFVREPVSLTLKIGGLHSKPPNFWGFAASSDLATELSGSPITMPNRIADFVEQPDLFAVPWLTAGLAYRHTVGRQRTFVPLRMGRPKAARPQSREHLVLTTPAPADPEHPPPAIVDRKRGVAVVV